MEENEKECPFCGKIINKDAKKCKYCKKWIDDEIICPFCAEKIKASAKKCRFCGEWLPQNEDDKEEEKKEDKSFELLKINLKNWKIITIVTSLIILIALILFFSVSYVPSCQSTKINDSLTTEIKEKYTNISNLIYTKESVDVVSKDDKGYTCRIDAIADDAPIKIEYSYKKASIGQYNLNFKVVLPDCHDNSMKKLVSGLIEKSSYSNIQNKVGDVELNNSEVLDFNKEVPNYKCQASAEITAKPGEAFVLNYWDYQNANNRIKCSIRYKTSFCGNGYTSCATLLDIDNCENIEE